MFLRRNKTASSAIAATGSKRVYLDHAAASPLHPEVMAAMEPYMVGYYANPSAIHQEGLAVRRVIDQARQDAARVLGIREDGVIFTSGGTESNNLALLGYLKSLRATGRAYSDMEVITTEIEHPATLLALAEAQAWGVQVSYLPLDIDGCCPPSQIYNMLSPRTVLVTLAHVNSEIGAIHDTHAVARQIKKYRMQQALETPILLHVDAAQSPLWLSCRLDQLGADMLSLDAGKCGGPKAAGILAFARRRFVTTPIVYGGGQEFGLRSGTESVAQIVGMTTALKRAQSSVEQRQVAVRGVRDAVLNHIATELPQVSVNGPVGDRRVANNINISLVGYDTEYAAIVLDKAGFAVSTKSACSSADSSASNVVQVVTGDVARARATLRITLGEETGLDDVVRLISVLRDHMRDMEPYRTTV